MSIVLLVRSIAMVLVTLCVTTQAATIYVSTDGNDTNDGLAWATAKRTVQAGLNAASRGSQVWVAVGTYVERIMLKPDVALYGGFAGTEDNLTQRDWTTHETVLDGGSVGTVVMAPQGTTPTTRIDGFTIRNGITAGNGGGICCVSASPTIANNAITGNSAYVGGGIYCTSSPAAITNNRVTRNIATHSGGGICCNAGGSLESYLYAPTMANNVIAGNSAAWGGGICSFGMTTIANNTIVGNQATNGGGIYFASPSALTSSTATAANVTSATSGFVWYGPKLTNTIIAFNSSGIYAEPSTSGFTHNCIHGNTAYNFSSMPGFTGTNGNISVDPLFLQAPSAGTDGTWGTADDDYGDLHLLSLSPCINAGDPAYVPAAGEMDMDGQLRMQCGRIDMGADETAWYRPGDITQNGKVNVYDLQVLAGSWGKSAGEAVYVPRADLTGDNTVNAFDLQVLAANWNKP